MAGKGVQKPWLKQDSYGYNKGGWGGCGKDNWGYGKDSWGYGKGGWGKGYWDFKGFGGKGKDGKKGRAPPLNSEFWTQKLGEENRTELDGQTYTGVIHNYNWKVGWGLILPDNPEALPQQVRDKLQEAMQAAAARGKEWTDGQLLYFRKPDVNHAEGFKLGKTVPCTFQVYVDEKGAGATQVSQLG